MKVDRHARYLLREGHLLGGVVVLILHDISPWVAGAWLTILAVLWLYDLTGTRATEGASDAG